LQQHTNISKLQYCSTSPYRRGGGEVVAGNVLTVFSDKKHTINNTNRTTPYIVSTTDYDPFGMIMNGRDWNAGEYRFGFNGQEKTDEVSGVGNHLDFKYRGYDPLTGRFWSVDPLFASYPWNSTYAFAENRVIDGIDLEGLEHYHYTLSWKDKSQAPVLTLISKQETAKFLWWEWKLPLNYFVDYLDGSLGNRSFTFGIYGGGFNSNIDNTIDNFNYWLKNWKNIKYPISGGIADFSYVFTSDAAVNLSHVNQSLSIGMQMNLARSFIKSSNSWKVNNIRLKDKTPQEQGIVYNYKISNGKIEFTSGMKNNGTFEYIIDQNGNLILGQKHFYMSGNSVTVKGAGELIMSNGKVTYINGNSGHYKPTPEEINRTSTFFNEKGISTTNLKIDNSTH